MKDFAAPRMEGQMIDEQVQFTLVELCRITGASEDEMTLSVAEGAFDPDGTGPRDWRFSGASLRRVRTAQRLASDLQINPPGGALALDLLGQNDPLRAHPPPPP